ncbi:hypothetical protein ACFU6S_36155 [Streptomyces sp. NPDC057456]|uniref:hypothetical protein n=1 Tax=Streptomyces sp. NPDC057456 TaxID=3346139 RepID=UPI00367F7758
MPKPFIGATPAEWTEWVREIRAEYGQPSIHLIAKRSRQQDPGSGVSKSVVAEVFSGRRLPTARTAYGAGLGLEGPQLGREPRETRSRVAEAQAGVSANTLIGGDLNYRKAFHLTRVRTWVRVHARLAAGAVSAIGGAGVAVIIRWLSEHVWG